MEDLEIYHLYYKFDSAESEISCSTCIYRKLEMDCAICTKCGKMWTPYDQFPKWKKGEPYNER